MDVIHSLSREHRLFRRLLLRLERSARFDDDRFRSELRNVLLILLPALERHEQIEDEAFCRAGGEPPARRLLSEVSRQHKRIDALREDLREAMQGAWSLPVGPLKSLSAELVERLKEHFLIEELRLWPLYAKGASRSLDQAIGRRTAERVQALEREVAGRATLISDYLDRRT